MNYREKPKDGAFYAPKIDIQIEDCARARVADGDDPGRPGDAPRALRPVVHRRARQQQRPMAIHRAIYGSLERFIGVLDEHFAGASRCGARRSRRRDPDRRPARRGGEELARVLRARGLRVEVDASDNRMQNKIRLAQEQKVPVDARAR
jgi:threonyl-tRNA synthetase